MPANRRTIVKSVAHSLQLLGRHLWLVPLLLCTAGAWAGDDPAFDPRRVEIRVHHGLDLPWNKPGFRIDVAHWRPHADLSISAINIKGRRVDLTPEPVTADGNGAMSLDVDYQRTGLTPGRWTLLVGEGAVAHRVSVDLPEIEWPEGTRPRFRMTYGAPAAPLR
jgi:hypothetical protein